MGGWNAQKNSPIVLKTCQSAIPRQKRGKHTKSTTANLQVARRGQRTVVGGVVLAGEEEEGQIQGEEEGEEDHGRAQGAEEQQRREDEPARQEEADGRVVVRVVGGIGAIRGDDAPVGGQEDAVCDPKAAVR